MKKPIVNCFGILIALLFIPSTPAPAQDFILPNSIHVNIVDTEDPIEIGKNIKYLIEVTNEGRRYGIGPLQFADIIPTNTVYVSADPAPISVEGNLIIFPKINGIKPGNKLVYKVTCKIINEGETVNHFVEIHDIERTAIYK